MRSTSFDLVSRTGIRTISKGPYMVHQGPHWMWQLEGDGEITEASDSLVRANHNGADREETHQYQGRAYPRITLPVLYGWCVHHKDSIAVSR